MTDGILGEITQSKRVEVAEARLRLPLFDLMEKARLASPPRDFFAALAVPGPIKLIAEVKKASPSARVIREDFDPVAIAHIYEDHGAACLSVLTDAPYFQGSLENLRLVRQHVSLPVLRKDFIIDEYQIFEARAAGADAILLIAEILDNESLARFQALATELGMAALVEFHDATNLNRVVDSGARLIGINNRDLKTFTTTLDHTLELRAQIPRTALLVSESGISKRTHVELLEAAGVAAILVGESLLRGEDIGLAVDQLLGRNRDAKDLSSRERPDQRK